MDKRKNLTTEVQILKQICKSKKTVVGYVETLFKCGDITEKTFNEIIKTI